MALSVAYQVPTSGVPKVPGHQYEAVFKVTADNLYPAGGYPFGIAQVQAASGNAYLSLDSVDVVDAVMQNATGVPEAFLASYDFVNGAIRIVALATDAELATNNTAANGFSALVRCRFR